MSSGCLLPLTLPLENVFRIVGLCFAYILKIFVYVLMVLLQILSVFSL